MTYFTKTGRPLQVVGGEVAQATATVLECHFPILRIYKKIKIGWFFLEAIYTFVNEDTALEVRQNLIKNHLPPLVIRKSFKLQIKSWTIWEHCQFL